MPEFFEELDRQADKWEPTAAAISLGSLGLGAGISTTAVGAPIGGFIAGVGQLPSLVIDGYQAGRGWYKTFKGDWKNGITWIARWVMCVPPSMPSGCRLPRRDPWLMIE